MVEFSFAANRKIIFGMDRSSEVVPHLKKLGGKILFLSGRGIRNSEKWVSFVHSLESEGVEYIHETVSGEPSPEVVDSICDSVKGEKIAGVMALGGGSVLDAGKAAAAMLTEEGSVMEYLEGVGSKEPSGSTLPFFALPTTAGTGSECTKNAVISSPGREGFKKSLRHDHYIPALAVVDPGWLKTLSPSVMASCGMDAFSQLLESYISTGASPVSDALARQGLLGFINSFNTLLEGRASDEDYGAIALGSCLSGLTLANAGLGTVHGIAGVIGGLTELPHGTACGLLLPGVMKKTFSALAETDPNAPVLEKIRILMVLSGESPADGIAAAGMLTEKLEEWGRLAALPSLGRMGFPEELIEKAAADSGNKNNPYAFSREERFKLIREVF
ncbi:MAG: iron-containing alcohol dehydrogenase [Spirochaetales bacterium]|nr:iron-containing alcohol dehydrogenase [Spirochaetales bacterium]